MREKDPEKTLEKKSCQIPDRGRGSRQRSYQWDAKSREAALWLTHMLFEEGLLASQIYDNALGLIMNKGEKDGSIYSS